MHCSLPRKPFDQVTRPVSELVIRPIGPKAIISTDLSYAWIDHWLRRLEVQVLRNRDPQYIRRPVTGAVSGLCRDHGLLLRISGWPLLKNRIQIGILGGAPFVIAP